MSQDGLDVSAETDFDKTSTTKPRIFKPMTSILVVEDEQALAQSLSFNLEKEGFEISISANGRHCLDIAEETDPDLILLDVMLPDLDGLEVCRELRARRFQKPILLLTARTRELDKIVGLEVGADDYITKPFSTAELVARIRAHLRRYRRLSEESREQMEVGELVLDLKRREVKVKGRPVHLSPQEFELLVFLMKNPDQTISRQKLLTDVWGYEVGGDPSMVNVAVQRLRDKIKPEERITTIRGVGYLFDTR